MASIAVFGVVAADIVVRVPYLPSAGDHVSGQGLGWRVGGSSANVACGLSSAGHDCRLIGPVGSDPIGDDLLDELRRWRVDTSDIFRIASSARSLILLDGSGERTVIALEGPWDEGPFMPSAPDLSMADCVYVESYTRFPVGIAESAGSAIIVSTPPRRGATSWPADIIMGSESQFGPGLGKASPYPQLRSIVGARLRWVIVTRGSSGADAYGDADYVHAPAARAAKRDATGAGDAFAAGLIHALLRGADIAVAMDVASAWGAEAVMHVRSLPPAWSDVLAAHRALE